MKKGFTTIQIIVALIIVSMVLMCLIIDMAPKAIVEFKQKIQEAEQCQKLGR